MTLPETPAYGDGWGSSIDIWPYVQPLIIAEFGVNACGLDVGCSTHKCAPWIIGLDTHRGEHGNPSRWLNPLVQGECVQLVGTATNLRWFADGQLDFVFSSHCLEHMPRQEALGLAIPEFLRVLKPGGLLFLYLPDGRRGHMSFHEWDPIPDEIMQAICPHCSEARLWFPHETLPEHRVVRDMVFSFLVTARKR